MDDPNSGPGGQAGARQGTACRLMEANSGRFLHVSLPGIKSQRQWAALRRLRCLRGGVGRSPLRWLSCGWEIR